VAARVLKTRIFVETGGHGGLLLQLDSFEDLTFEAETEVNVHEGISTTSFHCRAGEQHRA
jgi:hypothetical protein